ncbi:MAG: hypothetical protein J6Y82_06255, partial [Bacteroidales bacterium]|nr:hypothetical protein [Bacteroidales bacterium]
MKKTLTALLCAANVVAASAATEGALEGQFSVSPTKKIVFSKGNLQYQASTKTWRFAEKQYDIAEYANRDISDTFDGWIDLFGWGTGQNPTFYEFENEKFAQYSEWGANAISNGGNKANLWRTLTSEEWNYLLEKRTNAAKLRGFAYIGEQWGLVILPDAWKLPAGVTFNASIKDWGTSKYTATQWTKMEKNGAVFLPATRQRRYTDLDFATAGPYWSSTAKGDESAIAVYFSNNVFRPCTWTHETITNGELADYTESRPIGNAVRLVQDYIPPKSNNGAMSGKFSVSAAKKVFFSQGNLQYQATTKTWQFAENQWDYVGSANSKIAADNDGWIDLFGWGTGKKPTLADASDAKYALYSEWGANAISNGGKKINQWRTLTKTEWNYLIEKRKNAAQLRGMAAVEGTYGLVILPDDWTLPEGLTFNASVSEWSANSYNAAQWETMEKAGAIYLPAANYREGNEMPFMPQMGQYWSATLSGKTKAVILFFMPEDLRPGTMTDDETGKTVDSCNERHCGVAVRLVKNAPATA